MDKTLTLPLLSILSKCWSPWIFFNFCHDKFNVFYCNFLIVKLSDKISQIFCSPHIMASKNRKGGNDFLNVICNVIMQAIHAICSNIHVKILLFCPLGTQAKGNNINELLVNYAYQIYYRIVQKRCMSFGQRVSSSTVSLKSFNCTICL